MYQAAEERRWIYGYSEDNGRTDSGRVLTQREWRARQEQKKRRARKKRRKLAGLCAFYFLLGMAVAAGLFFWGKDWIGGSEGVGNAEAAEPEGGIFSVGGASLGEHISSAYKGIIYLDAGHGGHDQGTSYQEILEKDINLEVAKKVRQYLLDSGWQVLMTREEDVKIDNYMRAQAANEANASIFVSVHCNFLEKGEADGIEIYHDPANIEGGTLAEAVLRCMVAQTSAKDRGVRTEDFVVTRETRMPSILVELGYLSDTKERAQLMTDSYRNLLAKGIAEGILEYLE